MNLTEKQFSYNCCQYLDKEEASTSICQDARFFFFSTSSTTHSSLLVKLFNFTSRASVKGGKKKSFLFSIFDEAIKKVHKKFYKFLDK